MLGVPLQRVIAIVSRCTWHLRWIRDRPQRKPGNVDELIPGVSVELENEKILPFRRC